MMKKEWCSWAGIVTGAVALLLALTHFMVGPFSPQPSLESLVAVKATAIKHAAIAALQGKDVISPPLSQAWDSDRIVSAMIAVFATGAIVFGVVGALVCRESSRVAMAAVLLGVSAIALQFAIIMVGAIVLVILIAGMISALCG